jgi:phage shock protein PspC (stress-responsive transcriptional regulator)
MIQRSTDDRLVAGVIGGIAHHLGWSSTKLRIAYVAVSALSAAFPGMIAYGVLWFLMPGELGRKREFRVDDPHLHD